MDEDDPSKGYPEPTIRGPRIGASASARRLLERVETPFFMFAADDVIFRTPGWDRKFVKAMPEDQLAVLWPYSASRNKCFHCFTSMTWHKLVEVYPDKFRHFGADGWIVHVAELCNRLISVDAVVEHMHYKFGKSKEDATYTEARQGGAAGEAHAYLESTKDVRKQHAGIILKAIDEFRQTGRDHRPAA